METTSERKDHWLVDVLNQLREHALSITFVVVLFLLFWMVPQINDLIVVLNQADYSWGVVFAFFSSLSVMAFMISNVNAYLKQFKDTVKKMRERESINGSPIQSVLSAPKDAKEEYLEGRTAKNLSERVKGFHETQSEYVKRIFPKVLGTVLILIAAYAVNNTYQEAFEKDIFPLGNKGLLVGMFLLLLTLNQNWMERIVKWLRKYPWTSYIPIVVASLCFVLIVLLGFLNHGGSKGDIRRMFYSLMLLTLFFLLISISYNKIILWFKRVIGGRLIIALAIASLIGYIVLFVNPQLLKFLTPLPIVMICIIAMFTLINSVRLMGYRWHVPLLGIVVFLSVAIGAYTASKRDFTHFEATSVPTKIHPDQRLELDVYVEAWINDRKQDIQQHSSTNPFPIILVSAEGGGSRAGLWSFLVQSYLYDRNPDYFKKYLFAMTGASGGGVGNNMFYTQAYQLIQKRSDVPFTYDTIPSNHFQYRASTIYNKDYLSSSVASIMGRDLFKSVTDIGDFDDRGTLLENEWEASFNEAFEYCKQNQSPLAEPYLKIMPDTSSTYIEPLLITNTTHLQTGQRAIITPVSVSKDTHNLGVFMDLLSCYPKKDTMIKRSTAMSMNARFPYISPVARITGLGQFGDAGYYDNVGGTVTRRLGVALEKALKQHLKNDTTIAGKYVIKHLLITNYEKPWSKDSISYSSQLTGPASMIWDATFAHPTEMEKTFKEVVNVQSKRTPIKEDEALITIALNKLDKGMIIPFIPLGRYLSEAAVLSLEKRLDVEHTKLDQLIPPK